MAGGGKLAKALSKADIEKFSALGDAQRGAPERAMLGAARTMGGGVLQGLIEHVGDLTHRMSHHAKYGEAYPDIISHKVGLGIDRLESPYGFVKEMEENFVSNAKFNNIPLEEFRREVDMRLAKYAEEHKKLKVHNRPQYFGREAAVALGEQRWDDALEHLRKLQNILDTGEFKQEALKMVHKEGFAGGGRISKAVRKWRIWDTKEKVWASKPYSNKNRARTRMDKLDNEYGAYRYQVKEIESKAGGGKIRKVTRRDVLKGMGAGAAGALGAGKAGTKKGLEEVAEGLTPAALGERALSEGIVKKADFNDAEWNTIYKYLTLRKEDIIDELPFKDPKKSERGKELLDELNTIRSIEDTEDHFVLSQADEEYLRVFIEDSASDVGLDVHDYGDWSDLDDEMVKDYHTLENSSERMMDLLDPDPNAPRAFPSTSEEIAKGYESSAPRLRTERAQRKEPKTTFRDRRKQKKAGGGRVGKLMQRLKSGELQEGPALYEDAMDAIRKGDVKTAVANLSQLQEMLDLDNAAFSQMLSKATQRQVSPIHSGVKEFRAKRKKGPPAKLTDFPIGKQKFAEGGPPKPPKKGKTGALLQAAEMFARRAGKQKLQTAEIPKGFNSFYSRLDEAGDYFEIVGVRPDGSEEKLGGVTTRGPGGADEAREAVEAITGAWNAGGFAKPHHVPPLEELFGSRTGPREEILQRDPRKPAEIIEFPTPPIEGETVPPRGNRLRSFQEHLHNLTKEGASPEEIADLADVASQALSPEDRKIFMRQFEDDGLMPPGGFESPGKVPTDPDLTIRVRPELQSIKDFLDGLPEPLREQAAAELIGQAGDMGLGKRMIDDLEKIGYGPKVHPAPTLDQLLEGAPTQGANVDEMLQILKEAVADIPDYAPDDYQKFKMEVESLTGEQLQDRLMDILRKQGQTPIDIRRMSMDEMAELRKQGLISEDVYDQIYDELDALEGDFEDIITDIEGEIPDELDIVPDLDKPENYVIRAMFMDTEDIKYYAFDPERGPRIATPEEIKNFSTLREEVITPGPKKPRPRAPEGPATFAGKEYPDVTYVHEAIGNDLDELFEMDYDLDVYIDEFDLLPDPDNPGGWFAEGVVVREIDSNDLVSDEFRNFRISPEGDFEELAPHRIKTDEAGRMLGEEEGELHKLTADMPEGQRSLNLGDVTIEEYQAIRSQMDGYTGSRVDDYEMYPDPNRPGVYAVKRIGEKGNEGYIVDTNVDNILEEGIEEVEFSQWPPRPRFQEGGRVKKDRPARDYLRALGESMAGAIPFTGEEEVRLGGDIGTNLYDLVSATKYIPAGLMTQWWGINPTTQELEYAGPGADVIQGRLKPPYPSDQLLQIDPEEYYRQLEEREAWKPEVGAIPGIVDEAALMPALPQMVETMYDIGRAGEEGLPADYEPSIPAPEFSLDAAERAAATWDAVLEEMDLPEPTGLYENIMMAGGIMSGQLPLPLGAIRAVRRVLPGKGVHALPALTKKAKVERAIREWTEGALPPQSPSTLSSFLSGAHEFIIPSIDPKLVNYAAGTLAGGALLHLLTPDEVEEVENLRETYTPEQLELLEIWEDPNSTREEQEAAKRRLEYLELTPDEQALYDIYQDPTSTEEDRQAAADKWDELQIQYQEERLMEIWAEQAAEEKEWLEGQERRNEAMESLIQYPAGFAGGGKIRKVTRRELLKGLGAAAGTAAVAGKAGSKKGAGEALEDIAKSLEETAAPIAKTAVPKGAVNQMREIADAIRAEADDLMKTVDKPGAWEMEEIQTLREDAADYDKIGTLFEKGEPEKAIEHYDNLDTMARETFYDYLPDDEIDNTRHILGQAGSDWESSPIHMTEEGEALFDRLEQLAHDGKYEELSGELDRLMEAGYDTDDLYNLYLQDIRAAKRGLTPGARERGISKTGYAGPKGKAKKKPRYAGGGKIRKLTRREVLTGMGAAGATALGAGKAGTKKGLEEVAGELAAPAMTNITLGEFGPKTADIIKREAGNLYEGVEEVFRDDLYGMDPAQIESYARDLKEIQAIIDIDPDAPLSTRQAEFLEEVMEGTLEMAVDEADVDLGQRANQVMERLGRQPVEVIPKSARDLDYEKGPREVIRKWENDPSNPRRTKKLLEELGLDKETPEMERYREWDRAQDEVEEIMESFEEELMYEEGIRDIDELSEDGHTKLADYEAELRKDLPSKMEYGELRRKLRDRFFEGYPESFYYDPADPKNRMYRYAGGGKIRKGVTRRDVLKNVGAAAAVGLGAGKAGTKKGLPEATGTLPAAAKAGKTMTWQDIPETYRERIASWMEDSVADYHDMIIDDPEGAVAYVEQIQVGKQLLDQFTGKKTDIPFTGDQKDFLQDVLDAQLTIEYEDMPGLKETVEELHTDLTYPEGRPQVELSPEGSAAFRAHPRGAAWEKRARELNEILEAEYDKPGTDMSGHNDAWWDAYEKLDKIFDQMHEAGFDPRELEELIGVRD